MRHAIGLALDVGVFLDCINHGGDQLVGVDLAVIDRLIDFVFFLHCGDAILTGLRQIEASAAGGAQFGDHFLVVGISYLDVDAGLFFELFDQVFIGIAFPGDDLECFTGHDAGR